jgi:hypothetical protein
MRDKLMLLILVASVTLSSAIRSSAQSSPDSKSTDGPRSQQSLSASEEALVAGSTKAIIETGLSKNYFDAHFKLLKVIDQPSDRRVVWQFSVNGFQAIINDAIGYYAERTKRVDVHNVSKRLGQTFEIQQTLTRARALKIMKACIGDFESPSVEYGAVDGRAQLLMVAQARNPVSEKRSQREVEREREQAEKRKAVASGVDVIESERHEGDHAPTIFGTVNLQTGKCAKGVGMIAP